MRTFAEIAQEASEHSAQFPMDRSYRLLAELSTCLHRLEYNTAVQIAMLSPGAAAACATNSQMYKLIVESMLGLLRAKIPERS